MKEKEKTTTIRSGLVLNSMEEREETMKRTGVMDVRYNA